MRGDTPAAFPFFYIKPIERPDIVKRFLPGITDEEIGEIDTIGSSPVFIRKDDLERLAPEWAEMSVALQKDPEAKKKMQDMGINIWDEEEACQSVKENEGEKNE